MARHLGQALRWGGVAVTAIGALLVQRAGPYPTVFGLELSWWLVIVGLLMVAAGMAFFVLGQPRPCLKLNGSEAFHVETVSFGFPAEVLCMRIANRPRLLGSATATGVSAHFRIVGAPDGALPSLDARWSDTVEPPNLPLGQLPELAVNIGVNAGRQINLVVKEQNAANCYLFNNDSYRYSRGQNPAWAIGPGQYRALVTVSGDDGVGGEFECTFANHGRGGRLEVLSFDEL